jgi:hypothetical protein
VLIIREPGIFRLAACVIRWAGSANFQAQKSPHWAGKERSNFEDSLSELGVEP